MSKMNFAIALKMTTDQFKRGTDVVKKGLMQMQYQIMGMASALGLGTIGLSNMVSRFIDVARETNRARVALRNISGDAQGFSDNMGFLIKTSNKWGQELNGMTSEFAKFSAAASSAGISIKDQHSIFESFTRSITAFGMSSEDAHLSYLALSQMMSKGKISSEELRRQLGERMPVAMEAMARAVGVTIQELDGLLKAGKLISKDVMMPFVKEMEKMLPEVNVDNIETSVNRLKNTFTQLTQDLKIGEFFKNVVDWANKMLAGVQTSFARVVTVIVATIAGGKLFGAFTSLTQKVQLENEKILANKIQTEEQSKLATIKRVTAEKRYNELSALYAKASNEQKMLYYGKMTAAESAMNKARLREQAGIKAAQEASSIQIVSRWSVAMGGLKKLFISAATMIKSAFASIIPMAIIGVLTNFVMQMVEARKEAERIKNIFKDYQTAVNQSSANNGDIKKLKTLQALLSDNKTTEEQRKAIQGEIYGLLGSEINRQEDINTLIYERIALLRDAARAEVLTSQYVSKEEEYNAIQGKYTKDPMAFKRMQIDYANAINKGMAREGAAGFVQSKYGLGYKSLNFGGKQKFATELETAMQNNAVMRDINTRLPNYVLSSIGAGGLPETTGGTSTGEKSKADKNAPDDIKRQSGWWELLKYIEANKPKLGTVQDKGVSMFSKQQRDTTFDYKKSDTEKLEEEYNLLQDYINNLREEGKTAIEQIYLEEQNLTSLSDALKLSQLKEDIEGLRLDIFDESIDGITGFANNLDRVAKSWSRIANEDMSGFEKMVSIINALGDTIGAIVDTWQSYLSLKELISMKDGAMAAQEQILSGQKIVNDTAEATSASIKSGIVVSGLKAEQAAATGVMAAKSAAAYASLPGIGIGLAASQIAAMQALISSATALSSIPGFKDGGVVSGLYKGGDRQLIRANAGEMILNSSQQSKLFSAINKGGFGGGEVVFEISGNKLVGILNQTKAKQSRI